MKYIEIDEELYRFIASKTERIGESASDILRRLLSLSVADTQDAEPLAISQPSLENQSASASALFEKAKAAVDKIVNQRDQQEDAKAIEKELGQASVSNDIANTKTAVDFSSLVNVHLLEQQKGAVGRFMFLLASIQSQAAGNFNKVLNVQGKGRLYFARSKQELLDSSQSSNPKEIATSGYWVSTNNNTAKKQTILTEVLVHLGCDAEKALSIAEHI